MHTPTDAPTHTPHLYTGYPWRDMRLLYVDLAFAVILYPDVSQCVRSDKMIGDVRLCVCLDRSVSAHL